MPQSWCGRVEPFNSALEPRGVIGAPDISGEFRNELSVLDFRSSHVFVRMRTADSSGGADFAFPGHSERQLIAKECETLWNCTSLRCDGSNVTTSADSAHGAASGPLYNSPCVTVVVAPIPQ